MKTTLAIAIALATGVGTSVYAQNVKCDTITVSLNGQEQNDVSDSASVIDSGTFSAGPMYYKTGKTKLTDKDIIKYIAFTSHANANYYGAKSSLVLAQGELSGFFNITPDLASSEADRDMDGTFSSADNDSNTTLANSTDSTFVELDNGRHMLVNPVDTSEYPIGHMQPWGQIYVQWINTSGTLECENVTYFFAISVQECYDCFYMNSFVSDATFRSVTTTSGGPPCCGSLSTLEGTGKDSYYMTLSFDDTDNNPYLERDSSCYVGTDYAYFGHLDIPGDGVFPDTIPFSDNIRSHLFTDQPYVARFTLNGILTYSWSLKFINASDLSPDFIGTGSYAANGYGFIGLFCNLLTGTATFTEKSVKSSLCCDGTDNEFGAWLGWWYGVGAEYSDLDDSIDTVYIQGNDGSHSPVEPYPTPLNVSTSLSYHENFDATYPYNAGDFAPSAWPTPAIAVQELWFAYFAGTSY